MPLITPTQANNRNIKLEQIRLNSVKTEKTKAIAEFLPNVSANSSYGQRNGYYQGQTYDRSTKQTTQEIKLEQPIFDRLHSVSKYHEANYKIKSGNAKTSDKIQEISFAAVQSYYNLFRYQDAMSPFFKQKLLSKLINSDHYIFLTLNDQLLFCISLMHKRDTKAPFFLKNFLG